MKINLAENIRIFRKQKNMTQEELAERLNVSVGVISKWERGASEPEISILTDMASVFGLSVDALIGYEALADSPKKIANKITELKKANELDKALELADEALKKYPNNLYVVYYSARLFYICGIVKKGDYNDKAISLFNKALGLLDQNYEKEITEIVIKKELAVCLGYEGKFSEAIDMLKSCNEGGLNNDLIGTIYIDEMKQFEEGINYLAEDFANVLEKAIRDYFGFVNAYEGIGKEDMALKATDSFVDFMEIIKIDRSKTTYFTKFQAILKASNAIIYLKNGEIEKCRLALLDTLRYANAYDSAPGNTTENVLFLSDMKEKGAAFDGFYSMTAIDAVRGVLLENNDDNIIEVWEDILLNEGKNINAGALQE